MVAAIRSYEITDVEELSLLVREEFLPIVKDVPGFLAYYVVDTGDGTASSITVCEDEAGIEASTSRAATWIEERVSSFIESGPAVAAGPVTAEATQVGIPSS